MQHDTLKRLSKDLQGALSIPGNFLNRQAKKFSLPGDKKKKTSQSQTSVSLHAEKTSIDTSLHEDPAVSKTASATIKDDNKHCLAVSTGKSMYGSGGSIKSPPGTGLAKIFPKEEPPIIHCPPSVSSMDRFSPQRRAWIQNWGAQYTNVELNDVLKSGQAWDTVEGRHTVSGYSNPNEATGLLFVKLMQVTNKATTKIFDIEWTLRVGNVERTSYPVRSFKDNPGNTATMNEVFLFDVHEAFQLEMTVVGSPLPNKLGTLAGLSNSQASVLGQMELSFDLEPLDKSVRTFKLRRPAIEDGGKSSVKSDCEVVVMIGLHVLEEPVEDRAWETETLYQGFLTFMTRGGRMASWKRYWAVLEGRSIKLYDAEYQQRRDAVGVIPLAYILRVQPPDYDKVDVGANGFSMVADPSGINMEGGGSQEVDPSELDYCLYTFTDSTYLQEVWSAHLEEAIDQYQENMTRRAEIQKVKMARRLSRHSFESSVPPSPVTEGGSWESDMIDLRYIW